MSNHAQALRNIALGLEPDAARELNEAADELTQLRLHAEEVIHRARECGMLRPTMRVVTDFGQSIASLNVYLHPDEPTQKPRLTYAEAFQQMRDLTTPEEAAAMLKTIYPRSYLSALEEPQQGEA